jgi:cytochrome c-type biogenesis protein CcmH
VSRPPARRFLAWAPWAALAVAAVVALAVGGGAHHRPGTLEQRTLALAAQVRCPVCVGETAAQSQTPASQEIRQQIRTELAAGVKPSVILARLADGPYGPGILEKPPTRGIDALLWVGPVVAALAGVVGLVLAFRRWRPRSGGGATEADRGLVDGALGPAPGPDAPGAAGAVARRAVLRPDGGMA